MVPRAEPRMTRGIPVAPSALAEAALDAMGFETSCGTGRYALLLENQPLRREVRYFSNLRCLREGTVVKLISCIGIGRGHGVCFCALMYSRSAALMRL